MALRWLEGFESYSDQVSMIGKRWSYPNQFIIGSSSFQPGRTAGNAFQYSGDIIATPNLGSGATWFVGFAFKNVNISNTNTAMNLLGIRDEVLAQVKLTFNPSTKVFSVMRGDSTVLGTGTTTITTGTWYYIELSTTIDNTVGAITLKINGINEVVLINQDTQVTANAFANAFGLRGPVASGLSGSYQVDDIYICDDSGLTNNTFLGDTKIEAVSVIDNGNYSQWTPNVIFEPHFQSVQVLNDGLYVQSATPAQRESYTTSSLNLLSTIAGVQSIYWGYNGNSTQHVINASTRISVTDYDSAGITFTDTALKAYQHIWETNPDSAIAWTVSDVNNAEFGFKLTS